MTTRSVAAGRMSAVLSGLLGLIGVVLLIAGWVGTSGRAALSHQTGFMTLAVAGLVVAGGGAGLYVAELTRRLDQRSAVFEARLRAFIGEVSAP